MRNPNRLTQIQLMFISVVLVVLNTKCGPSEHTAEHFPLTIISGGPITIGGNEGGLSEEFIQIVSPVRLENCKGLSTLYIPNTELIRIDDKQSCNLYDEHKGSFEKNENADSSSYMRYIKNDILLDAGWKAVSTNSIALNIDSLSLQYSVIFSYNKNENAPFSDSRIKCYNNIDSLKWAIKQALCSDKERILVLINFKDMAKTRVKIKRTIARTSDPLMNLSQRLPLQDIEISCHSSDRKSFIWEGSDTKYEIIIIDRETSETVYKTNTKNKEINIATVSSLTDSHPYELIVRYKTKPKQSQSKKFSIGIYHQQKIIEPICCK